jgi:hypothetical protein
VIDSFRLRIIEPLTVGGYVALLVIGFHVDTREGWVGTLGGIAVLAFAAWTMSLRRGRAILDTPTSRIASAAQGYVELVGRGQHHPAGPLLSKLTGLPCLWYRYLVEQNSGKNRWVRIDAGRSEATFLLEDDSGRCLVDPEHAEVITRRKDTWMKGGYRYTEWLILPQASVYALGQFSTIGGANTDLDLKRDMSDLLAAWKRDKAALLARFDLDSDGEISEEEWLLARQAARREIRKRHLELRLDSGTHVLHRPHDGRLFLISDLDPQSLARRYRRWAWAHLAAFIAAVAGAGWLGIGL